MAEGSVKADGRVRVVLASTGMLSFLNVWQAAALVLAEVLASCFYAIGISTESIGISAPWFILGMLVFSYAVRGVYIESSGVFRRGGGYRAVRAAVGGPLAKLSLSVLVFYFLLSGALCAVSSGYYAGGLLRQISESFNLPWLLVERAHFAALFGSLLILVCALLAIRRVRASTALNLQLITAVTVITVVLAVWSFYTLLSTGTFGGFPSPADFLTNPGKDASDWLGLRNMSGGIFVAVLIGLTHAALIMSGEEALLQVSRDLQHPKVRNVKRVSLVVSVYSTIFVALVCFLWLSFEAKGSSMDGLQDLLGAITEHLSGSLPVKLAFRFLVVLVGVALLAKTAHASLLRCTNILGRACEQGVLPLSMAAPHPAYGTVYRVAAAVAALQVAAIAISNANLENLGEAFAFAIIWSSALKAVVVLMTRYSPEHQREWRVPLNLPVGRRELPLGLLAVTFALLLLALTTLLTREAATFAGLSFCIAAWILFVCFEYYNRKKPQVYPKVVEPFVSESPLDVSAASLHVRPNNVLLVLGRSDALLHAREVLANIDPAVTDLVALCVRLPAPGEHDVSPAPGLDEQELRVFARMAELAQAAGKPVAMLVVQGENSFDAILQAAQKLESSRIVLEGSGSLPAEEEAYNFGRAWERIPEPRPPLKIEIAAADGKSTLSFDLGPHEPQFSPKDLQLLHSLWLRLQQRGQFGPKLHHRDIVDFALRRLSNDLEADEDRGVFRGFREEFARPRRTASREEVEAMIESRNWHELREALLAMDPSDIAALIIDLPPETEGIVFRLLQKNLAGAVFSYLPREHQESLLLSISGEQVKAIANSMTPDDRARLIEELPGEVTQRLVQTLSPEELQDTRELMGYPPGVAGRFMTPRYVELRPDMTAKEALEFIKREGRGKETLSIVYVVDANGILISELRLGTLVLAQDDVTLGNIQDRPLVSIQVDTPVEHVVSSFAKYDRTALPVVDSDRHMLGIITVDDVLDVAQREATTDIQKLGGSEALDAAYLDVSMWSMIKKRGGWLAVLFLGETLTATAMGYYEAEIARAAVVALFVPLIISSGGNSGSQATSILIRSLALEEVHLRDWWQVFRRELFTSFMLGAFLGLIGFFRISLWYWLGFQQYEGHPYAIGATVGGSLIGVVMFGSLTGSMLPFLLRAIGLDPATASAPFVATLVDVTGLIIYFTVASLILSGTLL